MSGNQDRSFGTSLRRPLTMPLFDGNTHYFYIAGKFPQALDTTHLPPERFALTATLRGLAPDLFRIRRQNTLLETRFAPEYSP